MLVEDPPFVAGHEDRVGASVTGAVHVLAQEPLEVAERFGEPAPAGLHVDQAEGDQQQVPGSDVLQDPLQPPPLQEAA
ncbi:hypothetical protein [Streptomyces sp. DHE17-7]|uniref:hypothetical protein n=1 Tax=Streptomyces sp. DHE17-7 TaxID=2759949 RepID=UPI0022EA1B74|nr:hypothetical protein [Streptomyces sp. DHE17-7]